MLFIPAEPVAVRALVAVGSVAVRFPVATFIPEPHSVVAAPAIVAVVVMVVFAEGAFVLLLAVFALPAALPTAAGPELQQALVVVHQLTDFVRQLQGQRLQPGRFRAVHHHAAGGLVQGRHQLLVNDHFGDDRVDGGLLQLEHLGQSLGGDGVVDLGVSEQVGSEGFFLDLAGQHRPHFVGFVEQVPNLEI